MMKPNPEQQQTPQSFTNQAFATGPTTGFQNTFMSSMSAPVASNNSVVTSSASDINDILALIVIY